MFDRLMQYCQEYFSERSVIDLIMDGYPMLIGLVKSFTMSNDSSVEYLPEIILIDDVLVRTSEEYELELLLYQLIRFKEEFDENDRYFVRLDFI